MDHNSSPFASLHSQQLTILQLPLHLQSRLPPSLLTLSLTSLFTFHSIISLLSNLYDIHPSYSLPLSLSGLIITHLITSTSSHSDLFSSFTLLHLFSIPMDLIWLFYSDSPSISTFKDPNRSHDGIHPIIQVTGEKVSQICVALVGINMLVKLVSLTLCSIKLRELGIIEDVQGINYNYGGGHGPFGYAGGQQDGESRIGGNVNEGFLLRRNQTSLLIDNPFSFLNYFCLSLITRI